MEIKVGDSIVVNAGVNSPDYEDLSLAGWQGRVIEIIEEYDNEEIALIAIAWDSITLKQMPESYIYDSDDEGLSWEEMQLCVNEVTITSPRDTTDDVDEAISHIYETLLGYTEDDEEEDDDDEEWS